MALQGFTLADIGDGNITGINVLLENRNDEHYEAIAWLNTVQGMQDVGSCWSDAVADADKYV